MKKIWWLIGILVVCASFFLLGSCAQDKSFECDIWVYVAGFWEPHTTDTYSGGDASEADEACEDDWGSSYDCRNCSEE